MVPHCRTAQLLRTLRWRAPLAKACTRPALMVDRFHTFDIRLRQALAATGKV
jgi:hypothetical protein